MNNDEPIPVVDWDSNTAEFSADQRAFYDALRDRCPVARDAAGTWMLLSHKDVCAAARDSATFGSGASRFTSVPNSMDGDEHRRFRKVVDRFLDLDRVIALIPMLREVAEEVVAVLPRGSTIDAVQDIGLPVAVRAQSRWLGWPAALEPTLRNWVRDNHEATRSGELTRTRQVAARFDDIVREQVNNRRNSTGSRSPWMDVTSELMQAVVEDPGAPGGERKLTEAETVSILRNWTAGDLGSVARALGVVIHYVAAQPDVQAMLRSNRENAAVLDRAIDEILRIDDPFILNRRVTTREVQIGERRVPKGAHVLLNWTAANRDAAVFGEVNAYRPERNAEHNLVYGIGPHACPGRALATYELREALSAVFRRTGAVVLSPDEPATREMPPLGGYVRVPVLLA